MALDQNDANDRSDISIKCGPRCILEALLAIEAGNPVDAVLADFERLPPETYHAAIMAFCDGSSM